MYNQALTQTLAPLGFVPHRGSDFGAYQLEMGGLRVMLVAAADETRLPRRCATLCWWPLAAITSPSPPSCSSFRR